MKLQASSILRVEFKIGNEIIKEGLFYDNEIEDLKDFINRVKVLNPECSYLIVKPMHILED